MPTTVLTVVNLKGGTGKTTSAAYIASALHERGRRVMVFDADPQASLYTWHQAPGAAFPFPVTCQPSSKLHHEVPGIVGDRYDVVVIDTPPTERERNIVLSSLIAATHALVPVAPTPAEFERMRALRPVLEDAAARRPDEQPPRLGVLLVRTVPNAASTDTYREALLGDGWNVLRPQIGRRERFAQAFGEPVLDATATGYGDAVTELLGEKRAGAEDAEDAEAVPQ